MTRKIISLVQHHGYCFVKHTQKFLEEERVIDGMIRSIGSLDDEWEKESLPIYLANIDHIDYYSVIEETTIEMLYAGITNSLIPKEDYKIKIEFDPSEELSLAIFNLNKFIRDKYNIDNNYLHYLGLINFPNEKNELVSLPEE